MLNESQQKVYDLVMSENPPKLILLNGAGGTGKSYVVSKIVKDYPSSVVVSATTNKAKNLLIAATGLDVTTTHLALGYAMVVDGTTQHMAQVRDPIYSDLLVIDEVSMLPADLYHSAIKAGYKTILFVGDEAQLPAIGAKAKIEPDVTITLTKQMRQNDEDIKLADYLSRLRAAIKSNGRFDFVKDLPHSITTYESHREFCQAYKSCTNSKKILAYSNRCVDSYNLSLNGNEKFHIGDFLVIDKPIGRLKNGDVVEIVNMKETPTSYTIYAFADREFVGFTVYKTKAYEAEYLARLHKENPEIYLQALNTTLHPKHLWASTIHKVQGMSIDEVFVDVTDIWSACKRRPSKFNNYKPPMSYNEFLKLIYVAISRMRVKAHLFIGDKRNYKYLQFNRKE